MLCSCPVIKIFCSVAGLAGHESGGFRQDVGGHAQAPGSIRLPEHPGYRRDVGQDRAVPELAGGCYATAVHRRAVSGVFRTSGGKRECAWPSRAPSICVTAVPGLVLFWLVLACGGVSGHDTV